MSGSEAPADGGPVLQLLASALQLWIRQQCQAVDSLDRTCTAAPCSCFEDDWRG